MKQSILIGAAFGFILNFHSNYNPFELEKLIERTKHMTETAHMDQESRLNNYSYVMNSVITKDMN